MNIMSIQPDDFALSVNDLQVQFDTDEGLVTAVENVSFELKRGRVLAIVGESGSGKSVSAYSILRLIQKPGRITKGAIRFRPAHGDPVDIVGLSEKDPLLYDIRGGYISMIFQEPMTSLNPVHTVGNQICEAILLHDSVTKAEAEERAIEMLRKVGIPDPEQRLRQYPHEFSGGMRQRVVIAMALVCKPEVLIADEPTTALDVTIQAQILRLIKQLQEEMGTSVIFITHDLAVVAQIADDVVVMYKGRIVEKGTVREILKDPLHPYSKGLLAAIPSQANLGKRLMTVDKIIADQDDSEHNELKILPSGRAVALSDEAIANLNL